MRHVILSFIVFFTGSLFSQSNGMEQKAKDYLHTLHKPSGPELFTAPFHFEPLNQDTTNACWSFATLSFIESEMNRLGLEPVKLSMMYAFYFAFVEKAREYVRTKGESRFAAGDLFSGVLETIEKYGIVPYAVYSGEARGMGTFNHRLLEKEMYAYVKGLKKEASWDEVVVINAIRQILDKHLGEPPESFKYHGKKYTPKSFATQVISLPWQEYLMITSFSYTPFDTLIALDVPDNWAHRETFYNVPLDIFYTSLKKAVGAGFTVAFDSDTGEPGRIGEEDAVFVPEYDIPGKFINQEARELRFKNGSTTDDHLMHMLAYKEVEGNDWFLVKDSWRTAWEGEAKGYYYFHGDYIRLKVLAYLVHRDAVPFIRDKILEGE